LKGDALTWSPDFRRLAYAAADNTVKVWDAQTRQETLTLKRHSRWPYLAFSLDGKRLAVASATWDDTKKAYSALEVKVYDAETGQELLSLKGHTEWVRSVAFSPDGKRLASRSGAELKVWDAQTGQEIFSVNVGSGGGPFGKVAFSPDGKRVASS